MNLLNFLIKKEIKINNKYLNDKTKLVNLPIPDLLLFLGPPIAFRPPVRSICSISHCVNAQRQSREVVISETGSGLKSHF